MRRSVTVPMLNFYSPLELETTILFVTIGDSFQNSLETTSLLKELGAKLVISRAERDVQEKFLLRNGADKVVIRKSRLQNGHLSVTQMIISLIIWRWMLPMRFLR